MENLYQLHSNVYHSYDCLAFWIKYYLAKLFLILSLLKSTWYTKYIEH